MSQDPKTPPSTAASTAAANQGKVQQELKRIVQYISQVYQTQKNMAEQIATLQKRIDALDNAIGTIITATGKAVTDGLSPMEAKLSEAIEKTISSAITQHVIPQIKAEIPAPSSAPVPTPAPAPAPPPQPVTAPTPTSTPTPRRPSDVPDTKVATVIEALENIVTDLKARQRVQREYLKPLIETARDTAMNNLSSRAKAAGVFKELIALLKSSPSDLPPDTVASVIARLEDLVLHIRSS
ncbi:MAG: hypothetical protein ACFFD8_03130 [Candidatus Thorarchaeota archaeon]